MFEKEAEERAEEIEADQTLGVYDNDEDLARDKGYNDGYVIGYEEGFKDGAEFGYNKANEWHDLRKDPNDLPEEKKDVFVLYSFMEVGVKHLEWNKEWWGNGTYCRFDVVIAGKKLYSQN